MTVDTPARRIPVAVLGATGAVGQMFVRLLAGHPWFQLAELAASERSAGRKYAEAAHWIGSDEIPESSSVPNASSVASASRSRAIRRIPRTNSSL